MHWTFNSIFQTRLLNSKGKLISVQVLSVFKQIGQNLENLAKLPFYSQFVSFSINFNIFFYKFKVNQLKNAVQTHNDTIKYLEQQKVEFEMKLEENQRIVSRFACLWNIKYFGEVIFDSWGEMQIKSFQFLPPGLLIQLV